ncbi:unnamed protein product [Caenorhabditis nigoni]
MLILHLVCASFDLFVTIGILPVVQPPILAGYPLGFFYTLGVPAYVQSYIAVTILLMLGPSVTMFFESRYNVLVRKDSETKSRKIKRAIHNFANYLFTFLVFAPTVFNMPSAPETRRIFMEKLPCLPTEILDRPGYTMLGNMSIVRITMSVHAAISFIQVVAFFFPTWSHISNTKTQSLRTTELQKIIQFPILAGYPLGFFHTLGVPTYVLSYVTVTFLFLIGPSVILLFENRYNFLVRRDSEAKSRKIKRTTLHFANYLYSISASFDLVVTIGIIPVVQFPILAGYPLGFFYTLGVPSYVQSYVAVTILFMIGPSVAMFFESRYNFLVRKDSETKSRKIKRAIHHFVNYLYSILVFAPTVFNMPSPSETRRIFTEKLSCVPTEILDRQGYTMLGNLSTYESHHPLITFVD